MKKFIAFVVWVLVNAGMSTAQIKIHRTLNIEDGLPQSQILSMLEDHDGYMWFGTFAGLARWDGTSFANFDGRNGLTGSVIYDMMEDSTGLYLGTSDGVFLYHNDVMSPFKKKFFSGKHIRKILRIGNDEWFFATEGNGLFYCKDSVVVNWTEANGLNSDIVYSLALYKQQIIIATAGGLNILENSILSSLSKGLPSKFTRRLFRSGNGYIYICTDKGLAIYNGSIYTVLTDNSGLSGNDVWDVIESRDGKLYVATSTGVTILGKGDPEILTSSNGLQDDFVNSLFEDSHGTIYIGHYVAGGVSLYSPKQMMFYNKKTGLTENEIWSIGEDDRGHLCLGTYGSGLLLLDKNTTTLQSKTSADGLANDAVWCFAKNSQGKLLIGTDQGVSALSNGRLSTLNSSKLLPRVFALHTARNGITYIGTNLGLYKMASLGIPEKIPEFGDMIISSLTEDSAGTLYIGCDDQGLRAIQGDRVMRWLAADGLTSEKINGLHIFKNKLFIGTTGGGLIVFNPQDTLKPFFAMTMEQGLSDNTIFTIVEDRSNQLYLTSNKGITVLDVSGEPRVKKILTRFDGLPSDECIHGAAYADADGILWFGTTRGVARYNPNEDQINTIPPRIHLTRLRIFEDDVDLKKLPAGHVFNYNENYLKFDFIGIHLAMPERVMYRYRMSEVDPDWVETPRNFVQYSNLHDGHYTFEIQAANAWGVWSEPLQFTFTIRPPFWKTWWFIALIIFTVGGTAALIVYNRVQRVLAIERMRSKIAADFHDSIGAGLTQVHILTQIAALQPDKNELVVKNLQTIDHISQSLYEEMRDIIWMINPKRDSLYELIIRLKESIEEIIFQNNIEFITGNLSALQSVKLPMEFRRHLYMIFKEGINNALKYSGCKRITLEANVNGKSFSMTLKDDGKGFDLSHQRHGNGLVNMQERARAIGGCIEIETGNEQGCTIRFTGRRI